MDLFIDARNLFLLTALIHSINLMLKYNFSMINSKIIKLLNSVISKESHPIIENHLQRVFPN